MPAAEIAAPLTGLWWIVNICMPGNRSVLPPPPSQDKILILLCCRVDCRWSSFHLSDVQPLPWNRPVATFMAKNRFYYIDVFRCGGKQHQHQEGSWLPRFRCACPQPPSLGASAAHHRYIGSSDVWPRGLFAWLTNMPLPVASLTRTCSSV